MCTVTDQIPVNDNPVYVTMNKIEYYAYEIAYLGANICITSLIDTWHIQTVCSHTAAYANSILHANNICYKHKESHESCLHVHVYPYQITHTLASACTGWRAAQLSELFCSMQMIIR